MKRYTGSEMVNTGFYFNLKSKDLVTVEKQDELLPGSESESYIRVPVGLMMLFGPILGLLYVIFLPFISFAMVIQVLAHRAWDGLKVVGTGIAKAGAATWRPGFAYLTGKRHTRKPETPAKETKKESDLLTELEKEIEEKRNAI